jgi:hypothetical protein
MLTEGEVPSKLITVKCNSVSKSGTSSFWLQNFLDNSAAFQYNSLLQDISTLVQCFLQVNRYKSEDDLYIHIMI